MRLFVVIISVCIAVALFGVPAMATQSQLQQSINPLDCTLTALHNGSGTVINTDCPPQPPIVDTIVSYDGRPVITGKYDAANTLLFRVMFNGTWYTLGASGSPLTAVGNLWKLDLSDLEPRLAVGSYDIELDMTTTAGDTLSGSGVVTVEDRLEPPVDPPVVVTPTTPGTLVAPGAPNTGLSKFLQAYATPSIVIAAAVSGAAGTVAYHAYRRRKHQS